MLQTEQIVNIIQNFGNPLKGCHRNSNHFPVTFRPLQNDTNEGIIVQYEMEILYKEMIRLSLVKTCSNTREIHLYWQPAYMDSTIASIVTVD